MRLEGQARMGFYPIPPEVLKLILSHLRMPEKQKDYDAVCILDPCCGQADALRRIRDHLGVKHKRVYGIELDAKRADIARQVIDEGNIVGPASFFGVDVTQFSFGLVYLNPPFDDELGGRAREEERFLEKCSRTMVPGATLVYVIPFGTIQKERIQRHLELHYEDLALYRFPDEYRKFKEVVVIGKRRGFDLIELPAWKDRFFYKIELGYSNRNPDPVVGSDRRSWTVPMSWAPYRFVKSDYLPEELIEVVGSSPIRDLLKPQLVIPRRRPPLSISRGHNALLLAAGMLNGIVEPEGEEPHVVRGSTPKVEYVASITEEHNEETGQVTKKTVIAQRPVLTIRAVRQDGKIINLSDEVNTEGDDEADEPMDD